MSRWLRRNFNVVARSFLPRYVTIASIGVFSSIFSLAQCRCCRAGSMSMLVAACCFPKPHLFTVFLHVCLCQ
ncbi:hypothetical protein C8R45DRAFT_1011326 [Mycena sanguinolenta]|nr:hypothetical protein C8R45DRAFT_1011326 [Mycena sanguinolenta]